VAYKVFQYRLYPTKSQTINLFRVLDAARNLYNMALAERKYAYQLEQRKVTLADTEQLAKHYRATFPYAAQMYSQTAQSVVKQVDDAYQDFFRRLKKGEKAGYPRFKNRQSFNSFVFKQYSNGARLDGHRLKLFGIGRVRVRWHRALEGEIKTVRVTHKAGDWYVSFTCQIPDSKPLPKTEHFVGIDVGINALITTSDGEKVNNPHWYRQAQAELRRKQRRLSRAQRGSKNRKQKLLAVQRQHEHLANQRRDFLNKLVYRLVQNHHLSKSILDAGWGYFKRHLGVKAASAGRQMVLVNPSYTSKSCSHCGAIFQDMTLSTRHVECACGLSLDRDHNAAINIKYRAGWVTSVSQNVAPLLFPQRRE
jgi:putative transposase